MSTPGEVTKQLSRRKFLRRAGWGAAGLAGTGTAVSVFGERNWPKVYRTRVALPGLPAGLDGLTICQLSDLHRGPFVGEEFIRRGVALAMRLKAELIVLTGDFVSNTAEDSESLGAAISTLAARHGVYGVLGNHDYWTNNVEAVSTALTRNGVGMLTNRSVRLQTRGVDWWLCGVDDVWSGQPDLDAALRDVPEQAFKILLCHEPDYVEKAAQRGIPLQLSGHSHGGQVLLPGRRPIVTPPHGSKYPIGLQQAEGSSTLVYTNVGLGVIFPPIRINCPPEVSLITLAKT
jgi:uncharacterized protein